MISNVINNVSIRISVSRPDIHKDITIQVPGNETLHSVLVKNVGEKYRYRPEWDLWSYVSSHNDYNTHFYDEDFQKPVSEFGNKLWIFGTRKIMNVHPRTGQGYYDYENDCYPYGM